MPKNDRNIREPLLPMTPAYANNSPFMYLRSMHRVLYHMFRRKLGYRGESAVLAKSSEPLSNELIPCKPALFDPAHLDRVKRCGFKSTLAQELSKLQAYSFLESPREEYLLRDAVIAGGQIYTPSAHHFLSPSSPIRALRQKMETYDRATLLNSVQGLRYFGHWLRDDCTVYEDVKERPNLLSLRRPDWPDACIYEDAFQQVWPEVCFAHVEELTLYRELGFNRSKASRLRTLRSRLRTSYLAPNAGRIIYIRRGAQGTARNISNQDVLEAALSAAGVLIIEPEIKEQNIVRELLDAAMIITVEGSQANHAVYCLADGGSILILQPPERFYNPHHEWARLLGMNYGIVIGEKDGSRFHIYPDEVLRMIDQLQAAAQCAHI